MKEKEFHLPEDVCEEVTFVCVKGPKKRLTAVFDGLGVPLIDVPTTCSEGNCPSLSCKRP